MSDRQIVSSNQSTGKGGEMKIFNRSSVAALMAGGILALLPLDNLTEQLIGVVIAFLLVNAASYFIKGVQK